VLAWLFFKVLKPMLTKLTAYAMRPPEPMVTRLAHNEPMGKQRGYEENLGAAKQLAREDPKMIANVVKGWMNTNE